MGLQVVVDEIELDARVEHNCNLLCVFQTVVIFVVKLDKIELWLLLS
jgi:hypothetical protein